MKNPWEHMKPTWNPVSVAGPMWFPTGYVIAAILSDDAVEFLDAFGDLVLHVRDAELFATRTDAEDFLKIGMYGNTSANVVRYQIRRIGVVVA